MSITQMKKDILYQISPSSIQSVGLKALSDGLKNIDIVDPTNAFMFLMGFSAASTASAIENSESVTKTINPLMSVTEEDLYRHMSDLDYIDRFSTPANVIVTLLIPYDILLQEAIFLNNNVDVKTIKFPKYTAVTINGITVSTSHPILIEIYPFDQIQVRYDISELNPMEVLTTNVLEHYKTTYNNEKYLCVKIPMKQYHIISGIYPVESTVSFSKVIHLKDNYFFCRVYTDLNNTWTEIKTTHSPVVYDINSVTAVLKVVGSIVSVTIPEIYNSLRQLGSNIRIDIFSTKGKMDLDLSTFSIDKYSARWHEYDTLISKRGSIPLNNINDMLFFSDGVLSGGTNPKTLDELRQNVIYRNLGNIIPIREMDISTTLSKLGYTVEKYIDTVTNRMYIASKRLPRRVRDTLSTNVLVCNLPVLFNLSRDYILTNHHTSILNHPSNRVTILPDNIYNVVGDNISILTDTEKNYLHGLTDINLCNECNSNTYLYSPFYYIVDNTKNVTNVKCFNLKAPMVISRTLEDINKNRNYNVNTTNISIVNNNNQYIITVNANKPNGLNNIHCQLRYTDINNNLMYLLPTEDIFNTYNVYTFTIDTTFDINSYDEIEIVNGFSSVNKPMSIFMSLTSKFELLYTIDGDVDDSNATLFDDLYLKYINNVPQSGVTYETLTTSFGQKLTHLYTPITEYLTTTNYKTYPADVLARYSEDVYEYDSNGFIKINIVNNVIEYNTVHRKDDLILENGNSIVLHNKGDVILQPYLNQLDPNIKLDVTYSVGMTLVDYKYTVGNTNDVIAYNNNIPKVIDSYLDNEIKPNAGTLHELSKLYFKPSGSPSTIQCNIGDNTIVNISGKLTFNIIYYLTKDGLSNDGLKKDIINMTRNVISDILDNDHIYISEINAKISALILSDVKSFYVSKINDLYTTISTVYPNDRFNVNEDLVMTPDGKISIVDSIYINFLLSK